MKDLSKQLDILIQQQASKHRCYYCGTAKNVVGHHIIRRSDKLYRWDLRNILPVCISCHRKIHDGFLKEPDINIQRESYKEYLAKNGLTEQEFLINKYKELTGQDIEIKEKTKNLLHKPKVKKEKTEYELKLQEQQREYRKRQYQYYKKMKKSIDKQKVKL